MESEMFIKQLVRIWSKNKTRQHKPKQISI